MIELAQVVIPTIAIIISVIALMNSHKDVQKQIRVNKLEEILEIISVLESYYSSLYRLANDYAKVNSIEIPTQKLIEYNQLIKRIESFISSIDKDKLQIQFARLSVLSNAYLPNNKIRLKIMALSHLYDAIFYFTDSDVSKGNQLEQLEKNYQDFLDKVSINEWYNKRMAELTEMISNKDYNNVLVSINNKGIRNIAGKHLNISDFTDRSIKLVQGNEDAKKALRKYFPEEIITAGNSGLTQ